MLVSGSSGPSILTETDIVTAFICRRSDTNRFSVGLYFKDNPRGLRWADGGMVADDTPWADPPPVVSETKPFGRMKGDGTLLMTKNIFQSYSLCGRRKHPTCIWKNCLSTP